MENLEAAQKISLVMITFNEAHRIAATLEAAGWCDEIIIVDSGSTDNTIEICQNFGAKVFHHTFDGYGKQKSYAVAKASYDWVLSIDADEVITAGLKDEIEHLLHHGSIEEAGFYVPRTLVFLNKIFQHGREHKMPVLRLFNKKKAHFNKKYVHEGVELTTGKSGVLKHELLHYSYDSLHDYFRKFNAYSSMAAEEAYENRKTYGKALMMIRMPVSFFNLYLVQGNFLNGFRGFVWSLFSAFYPVVKYVKLYELKLKETTKVK